MKKTITQIILLSVLPILLLPSCEDAADWYLGFHKQPDFFDGEEYSKVINVFGIIRPDEINGEQQSFIRVEKTVSSKEIEFSDSLLLPDANVMVRYNDSVVGFKTSDFVLEESENDFFSDVYKSNKIDVVEGKTYNLVCSHPEFDTVFATTTVPKKPVILSTSISDNIIEIKVEFDSSAFLYEAVYNSTTSSGYLNPNKEATIITIELDTIPSDMTEVLVFVYDKNLAEYFSDITSSILNLNSYRSPYTTVDGGYGCFGSLNFLQINI